MTEIETLAHAQSEGAAIENYYNLINIPLEIESDGFCAIAEARTK